ncbi:hypothetical protein GCM10020256_29210 [Streptomyces thermocoprophilus]
MPGELPPVAGRPPNGPPHQGGNRHSAVTVAPLTFPESGPVFSLAQSRALRGNVNQMQGLLLAGRYRLADSIGSGGMGRVWRAHDELLHRAVAIKELTAALYVSESEQAVLLARTRAEARAAARINHSAVVTVHDVLEHDGRPWIVMELVEGRSLADAVKEQGRVAPEEAARIGLWVLRALRAAHSAGVLHRDVKPGNVLLGHDGRVLLTDFGIAQIEGDTTITRTGEVVGSVDYLAPERVRGHDPGPSSDLWALGATLYTAVEGRSPFRRTSPLSTMQAVVEEEADAPSNAGPLTPRHRRAAPQGPGEQTRRRRDRADARRSRRGSHARRRAGLRPDRRARRAAPRTGPDVRRRAGTPADPRGHRQRRHRPPGHAVRHPRPVRRPPTPRPPGRRRRTPRAVRPPTRRPGPRDPSRRAAARADCGSSRWSWPSRRSSARAPPW